MHGYYIVQNSSTIMSCDSIRLGLLRLSSWPHGADWELKSAQMSFHQNPSSMCLCSTMDQPGKWTSATLWTQNCVPLCCEPHDGVCSPQLQKHAESQRASRAHHKGAHLTEPTPKGATPRAPNTKTPKGGPRPLGSSEGANTLTETGSGKGTNMGTGADMGKGCCTCMGSGPDSCMDSGTGSWAWPLA